MEQTRTRRRATAPGLSRQRIVEAALALVADETLAGLSTRRLGQRLGVEAMSIYHHFPSKQHLVDALVDHALSTLRFPPDRGDPLARLRETVDRYREVAQRFPQLYPLVAIHRLNTPVGVRWVDTMLGLFHDVVPDVELAARHFRAVGYYLMGCCLDETAGYATGPTAAEPVSDAYVADHCPRLARAGRWFAPAQWQRTYELGLDALFEALARDGEAVRGR